MCYSRRASSCVTPSCAYAAHYLWPMRRFRIYANVDHYNAVREAAAAEAATAEQPVRTAGTAAVAN